MVRITDPDVQPFETEHIEAVRTLAPECVVLLKNEGILPFDQPGKLALYGSGARRTIKGGTGSGDVNVRHFVTIEEGLAKAGFEITSGEWLDGYEEIMTAARARWIRGIQEEAKALGTSAMMLGMGRVLPEPDYELPLDAQGDTAVYVLSRISGEGSDRTQAAGDINLSQTEIRDILALNEKYEKFVLVLNIGGMVNLEPVAQVKSILLLGQLGTPTGDVCADILLGKSYPSGKLTMTWAPIDAYPSTEGFADPDDTCYKEGIYVGYRYFDTFGKTPTYPFGYGLSFTTFETRVTGIVKDGATGIGVSAVVKNTGVYAGKEVVQVYSSAPQGKLDKPYQELRAFGKTSELMPGESEVLNLTLDARDLASYSEEDAAWIAEAGDYIIRVGSSAADTQIAGVIRIDEDAVVCQARNAFAGCTFEDQKPQGFAALEEVADVPIIGIAAKDLTRPAKDQTTKGSCEEVFASGSSLEESAAGGCSGESTGRISWQEVKDGKATIDAFMNGLTQDELIDICIGEYTDSDDLMSVVGNASAIVAGGAGDTTHHVASAGLESLSMADGPAGIRVSRSYKIVNGEIKSGDSSLAAMVEFMGEDELALIAQMAPQPSPEEQAAPMNYQYCIAIPIGTALAQSFNEDLCIAIGDLVGKEMELFGVNYWLAPALNIMRNPLCGRNFEYYSEDPLLAGKVASAITKGVQTHKGCGTTIKHFAANNQETNRYSSNSIVSERAMREIYLKGFEIAVKESAPEAIMTSYNLINGEHSCNRRDLLTDILREEWGYKGVVMTDWLTTTTMMASPNAKYGPASAAGCVKAGNNITMPGMVSDAADIRRALQEDTHPYTLSDEELKACVKPVLEAVKRLLA